MNKAIASQCSAIFEEVMTSPLGYATLECLVDVYPEDEDENPLLTFRNKLESQEYETPQDFSAEVDQIFTETARNIGFNTELGYSLSTLSQLIQEGVEERLKLNPSEDLDVEVISLQAQLNKIIDSTPNNLDEFLAYLESCSTRPIPTLLYEYVPPYDGDQQPDPHSIYERIQALPTDHDVDQIINIIVKYETNYTHMSNILELDFSNCQNYTLNLIQKYLDKVAPIKPTGETPEQPPSQ